MFDENELKAFEQIVMLLKDKEEDLIKIKYKANEAVGRAFGDRITLANRVVEIIHKDFGADREFEQAVKSIAYMLTGVYEAIHEKRYEILRKYCPSLINYYPKERRKRMVEKAYEAEERFKNTLDMLRNHVLGQVEECYAGGIDINDADDLRALEVHMKSIGNIKKMYNEVHPIVLKDIDGEREIGLYKEKEYVKQERNFDGIDDIEAEDFKNL